MKTNTSPIRRGVALLAAFVCAAGFAAAASDSLHHSDKKFIEKTAKNGMEEVAVSQIAVDRSMNPQVKEFAAMMVTDHSAANAELSTLAASKGVSLPAKDDVPHKWSKKDSKDFDKDYIDKMVDDHQEAVKDFKKEAEDGKDADTKAWARKVLPKLQHHLEKALDLKRALK